MFTLSFDETGSFEMSHNKHNNPILLAGFMFDDKDDENEVRREKDRISEYLKKVCNSIKKDSFPRYLHSYDGMKREQSAIVQKIKAEIIKSLGDFFKYGTYKRQELTEFHRKGEYHLFSYVKGKQGKSSPQCNNDCLAKEEYAGNLYTHMTEDMLIRLIFHNPVIRQIKSISLDLPSRRVAVSADSEEKQKEFENLGYIEEMNYSMPEKKRSFYKIGNMDQYRAAISIELQATTGHAPKITSMRTREIKYKGKYSDMEFLWMSDIICSLLRDLLIYEYDPEKQIEEIETKFAEINKDGTNMVFGYGDTDMCFAQALSYFEEGKLFDASKKAYQMNSLDTEFTDYYRKKWLPLLEKDIIQFEDISLYEMAVDSFYSSVFKNNINQGEINYIFKILEKCAGRSNKESCLYKLYDAGISVYNHLGKTKKAKECFNECEKHHYSVSIDQYIRTLNKTAVTLNDKFEYDKALEITEKNIRVQNELDRVSHMLDSLPKGGKVYSPSLGRILSQKGQILASKGDEKAEKIFRTALNKIEPGTFDYYITQSYLMHYYIDTKNKTMYEKEALIYFGGCQDVWTQLDYIVKEGTKSKNPLISFKFAYFLFIKALYVFYSDELLRHSELKRMIKDHKAFLVRKSEIVEKEMNGHPWEIIYKYLALIALKMDEKQLAVDFIDKSGTIIENPGHSIELIIMFGKYEFYEQAKEQAKAKKEAKKLWKGFLNSRKEPAGITGQDEYVKVLKKAFIYMYH